jgi:hypothetical protein
MIQQLPPEGLKAIFHLLNAITRLEYWPNPLKKRSHNDPQVGENPNGRNVIQAYQPPTGYLYNPGETPPITTIK